MAIRLDTYYEENKNLSLKDVMKKIMEIEAWLNSDERKAYEEAEMAKPIEERIADGNIIENYKSELEVLRRIEKEQSEKLNETFKLSNGKYATDLETKEAFDNYMNKVNRYNEQVANGQMPDINMGDILNEYENKFYDEELENKIRQIKNDWDNKPKDDNLDKIISDIDKKIDELDNKDDNNHFYKNKEEDTIWWVENSDKVGEHLFSFDKERIFNLFRDYPNELTPEQKEIFDKENPYWADFFKDRTE